MGHWAKIDDDNRVSQVVVADDDKGEWLSNALGGVWVQTSYNTRAGVHYDSETGEPSADQSKALRGNFAGIGMVYDSENDLFITEQPYDSWVLNVETATWEAPTPRPETGEWEWDESAVAWVEVVEPSA